MLIRFMSAALLALLTAGCITPTDGFDPSSPAIPGKVLLQITAAGAGGLSGETAYSNKAIEEALPGFTTQPIQIAVEDHTLWTIGAFHEGFQVLQVLKGDAGRIGEVHGVTHHLAGPNGERIGMSLAQIGTSPADCRVGRDLWRGMAICSARGTPNVTLVYAIPGFEGPFDRLPPSDRLGSALLQRIIWRPAA